MKNGIMNLFALFFLVVALVISIYQYRIFWILFNSFGVILNFAIVLSCLIKNDTSKKKSK